LIAETKARLYQAVSASSFGKSRETRRLSRLTQDCLANLITRPELKLMNNQKAQPKETPGRNRAALNDNAPSLTTSARRSLLGLPRVWIALSGLATLVWLVGIGWVAFQLFRWLAD